MNARFLNYFIVRDGIQCVQSIRVGGERVDDSNPELVAALEKARAEGGKYICLREVDRDTGLSVKPPMQFQS